MSRLDYITIGIVAACIIAIIFLVYKMTNLFDDNPETDPIETSAPVEVEDTTYQDTAEDLSNGEADSDEETTPYQGAETTTDDETATPVNADNEEEEETPAPPPAKPSYSSGKYMVIAGTFSKSALAKSHVSKLKSLGFDNARIEPFDRGKYDVVLVDRFDNMADAERLVKSLKAKGVASYVKAKEEQ